MKASALPFGRASLRLSGTGSSLRSTRISLPSWLLGTSPGSSGPAFPRAGCSRCSPEKTERPPTPLRDLAAWLAALSPELRPQLMERDPVAVLRYGDIANLPTGDKRELLGNLAHDPWRLHRSKWPESALRGLAGPDMKTVLQERLREGDRSPAAQMLVVIVAKTLNHSPVAAELAPDLLAVVRDPIRPSTIRQAALDAWVHALRKHPDRVPRLRHLLMELRERRIPDGQGELMAALLEALYPASIGPSEIWDCLRPGSGPVSYRCFRFWKSVGETCPDDHLPGHLDRLSQTIERFRARVRTRRLWNLPLHLLARAVWIHGSQVEPLQLIRWLQVGLDAHGTLGSFGGELPKEARRVAAWLEANPRIQKAVIRAALRTEEFRESESAAFELDELLYRSRLPDDIGHWHLGEAVSTRGAHLAEPHLTGFLAALAKEPVDVDRELADARSALKDRPAALRYLETHLSSRLPEDYFQQKIRRRHLRPRHPRTETRLLDATRSAEEDLVGNRASPRLLQRLAERCYQDSLRGPSDLRPSLREALGGDARLEKAVRKGLRNTIEREDLPSAGHLLRLRRQGRQSVFVGPVLVGLADREPAETASLSDERLRAALTFRLLGGALATKAAWYGRCLRERPDLVAETLVSAGRVLLKSGETSIPDVLELAQDDQYATVARRATLPLLRSFPARAREAQLSLLDALLRSGLRYLRNDRDRSAFERVIARKAAQPSTTRIGRVHWLAAGLLLNPDRFEPSLSEEVSDSDSRVRSFSGFFEPLVDVPQWFAESLVLPTLEFLVRTLGRSADPIMTMAKITPVDPVSVVISHLIVRLSHCPEQGATEALTRLASDTGLAKWRQELESGLDAQRVIRRDASYRPPEPAQLIRALRDGPPASAADLRELVVDRLKTIDTQLRTTDANPWQMFWNQDRYGRPTEPKPETACRDALLDLLRSKLPEECRAHPERHFAAGKRADITVSFGDFRVPVEVKKNSHRSLWRAVRNQLLPRSTNDPATEGLGIYLVLWLQPERTAPAPEGRRPASAAQLRKRLVESLSPEERRRAAVVVMDATPP